MALIANDTKSFTHFAEINTNEYSYKFLENNILYQGQLLDDQAFHGFGKAILPNGDIYEGNWNNNQMDGYGKYTTVDEQIYEGYWEKNQFTIKSTKQIFLLFSLIHQFKLVIIFIKRKPYLSTDNQLYQEW